MGFCLRAKALATSLMFILDFAFAASSTGRARLIAKKLLLHRLHPQPVYFYRGLHKTRVGANCVRPWGFCNMARANTVRPYRLICEKAKTAATAAVYSESFWILKPFYKKV